MPEKMPTCQEHECNARAQILLRLHSVRIGFLCFNCADTFMEKLAAWHGVEHPEEAKSGLQRWKEHLAKLRLKKLN